MPVLAGSGSLQAFRSAILRIVARNGMSNVRVFGSVARGESGPDSDLDLLVDLEPGRSLFDIIAAKQGIEELIGRRVDVVTAGALRGCGPARF
jgi:predicted nucleotidyltransferase